MDGSPHAMEACRHAVELARRFAAPLTALYVAEPANLSAFDSPQRGWQLEQEARLVGQQVLDDALASAAGAVAVSAELVFGDPVDVICQRARELPADLVVLGSRGLGLVQGLLLGSVSLALVRRAPCSVLVVRSVRSEAP